MDKFWLKSDYFKWPVFVQSESREHEQKKWAPYEYIEHCSKIANSNPTRYGRADIISNLKKALRNRVATLDLIYNMKGISVPKLPKGQLDRLVFFDVVKPNMYNELISIRNGIEHAETEPPQLNRCNELIEFTWYFLKSTDRLIETVPCSIGIMKPDKTYESGWMSTGPELDWNVSITGTVPPNFVSMVRKEGWLEINASKIKKVGELKKEFLKENRRPLKGKKKDFKLFHARPWNNFPLVHINFSGQIEESNSKIICFTRYFASA